MVDFLSSMNVRLIKVEVNDMRDNVYYATIHMEKGRSSYAVDARPSDAIALALRTGAPIFVDEEVLGKSKTIDLRIKEGKTPEEPGARAGLRLWRNFPPRRSENIKCSAGAGAPVKPGAH